MGSVAIIDCERIPDEILEGAFTKYRAFFKERQLPEGVTKDSLLRDCPDCNAFGLLGSGYYEVPCCHRNTFLAMEARAYGFTVKVTNSDLYKEKYLNLIGSDAGMTSCCFAPFNEFMPDRCSRCGDCAVAA